MVNAAAGMAIGRNGGGTPSTQALMGGSIFDTPDASEPIRKKGPVSVDVEEGSKGKVDDVEVDEDIGDGRRRSPLRKTGAITKKQWLTVILLTLVNLLNYMDRYTIAGVLNSVKKYYAINDAQGGALHTVFVSSYMVVAPIFGYLGDRFSRKYLMALGLAIWLVAVVVGSFMESFVSFLVMRALVGIGEASYSTIAPTILSDLFVKDVRSKMLALFYFAIPVGSGLGYVIGQGLASAFGDWRWSMRGTPMFGVAALILIVLFLEDPPRGGSECHEELKATSYRDDLRSLTKNRSFVFSTLGLTCVSFCSGSLSWWGPNFLEASLLASEIPESQRAVSVQDVSFIFGIIAMVSGIIGVPAGAILSTKLKKRYPRADPVICGVGLTITTVMLSIAYYIITKEMIVFTLIVIFIAVVALNLNWSIVTDILLYVVVPTRRGTAEAIQILFSHLLGDAGSPYLTGFVSDALKNTSVTAAGYCGHLKNPDFVLVDSNLPDGVTVCDMNISFYSMLYSLFVNLLVVALGAVFFYLTAIWIVEDKRIVDSFLSENNKMEVLKGGSECQSMIGQEGTVMHHHHQMGAEDSCDDCDEPPIIMIARPSDRRLACSCTGQCRCRAASFEGSVAGKRIAISAVSLKLPHKAIVGGSFGEEHHHQNHQLLKLLNSSNSSSAEKLDVSGTPSPVELRKQAHPGPPLESEKRPLSFWSSLTSAKPGDGQGLISRSSSESSRIS